MAAQQMGWQLQLRAAAVGQPTGAGVPRSCLCTSRPAHPRPPTLLQGAGVLKATNLRHHHQGSPEVPTLYRINDKVQFLVDLTESSLQGDKPYE
jgi:hypothetical protein